MPPGPAQGIRLKPHPSLFCFPLPCRLPSCPYRFFMRAHINQFLAQTLHLRFCFWGTSPKMLLQSIPLMPPTLFIPHIEGNPTQHDTCTSANPLTAPREEADQAQHHQHSSGDDVLQPLRALSPRVTSNPPFLSP